MVNDYPSFAAEVRRLDRALAALAPLAAAAGVAQPAGQEWFDLLRNKLLRAARPAAAAGRGNRRRHEHRQVGDLQSPGRRGGQRLAARWRPARNTRCAWCRRSWPIRPCSGGCSSRSRSAPGRRPTIRSSDSPENRLFLASGPDHAAAAAAAGCPRRGFRRRRELATGDGPSARRPTCWWPC